MLLYRETLKNSSYKFRATYTSAQNRKKDNISTIYPTHIHDSFIEFEYVYDGYMKQNINGNDYFLESGTITILRPTDYHNAEISSEAKLITVHFMPKEISRELLHIILNYEKEIVYTFPHDEAKIIFDASMQLCDEYSKKEHFFENICRNLIENICYSAIRKLNIQYDEHNPFSSPMEKAILHLQTSFMNNPSLEEIANYVHLNPSYFSRSFVNHTGCSYNTYLNNLKLKYAKKLLTETNMTITDICFGAGFGSLSNFSRRFKFEYKISANDFRRKYGKIKTEFYDKDSINMQY